MAASTSTATADASLRGLLADAQVRRVTAGGLVGRFREAGTGLALILVVRGDHGTFATAGAASAAYLIGAAVTRPLHGRWVDRRGVRRPLLIASLLNAAALVAVALAAVAHAPPSMLIALSAVAGITLPALSAALRGLWPRLAPGSGERAYALDTFSYELSLIGAPALVGLLAVVASPALAVIVITALGWAGTAIVVSAPATRASGVGPAHAATGRRLTRPVMTLIAVSLFLGGAEGSMTVLAPGVAAAGHDHAAAGLLLACLATGSLVGALGYGALGEAASLGRRLLATAAALTAALALLAAGGSTITGFAVCAIIAGITLSPALTVAFTAIRRHAAAGSLTEAFTWASFAAAAGAAIAQALAGLAVDGAGAATALWVAPIAAFGALVVAAGGYAVI